MDAQVIGNIQHNLDDVLLAKNKQIQKLEETLSDLKQVGICPLMKDLKSVLRASEIFGRDSQVRGEAARVPDPTRGTRLRAHPQPMIDIVGASAICVLGAFEFVVVCAHVRARRFACSCFGLFRDAFAMFVLGARNARRLSVVHPLFQSENRSTLEC